METKTACPICTMNDILLTPSGRAECVTCGHEWDVESEADANDPSGIGEVRDATSSARAIRSR